MMEEDKVSLVYFSTFQPIDLTLDSVMQQAGVPILYDSASKSRLPCLYTSHVANVLVSESNISLPLMLAELDLLQEDVSMIS